MQEFQGAGREDLAEKEAAQIKVLEEYASGSGIESVTSESLREVVQAVMSELAAEGTAAKSRVGEAMKRLLAPGGPLDGKDVAKAEVVQVVKEVSSATS